MVFIKIDTKDKSTTIRLTDKTKKMLEAVAVGKETHEQIVLRLIKLANNLSAEHGSKIIEKENMLGTKYERVNRTLNIEADKKYSIVCVYNNLGVFAILRNNKQLNNYISPRKQKYEWELDLDIVNIKKGSSKWEKPKKGDKLLLLYLASLKQILEDIFDIKIYEIMSEDDYIDIDKWRKAYERNNLSMESFYSDVEKKLQENE